MNVCSTAESVQGLTSCKKAKKDSFWDIRAGKGGIGGMKVSPAQKDNANYPAAEELQKSTLQQEGTVLL